MYSVDGFWGTGWGAFPRTNPQPAKNSHGKPGNKPNTHTHIIHPHTPYTVTSPSLFLYSLTQVSLLPLTSSILSDLSEIVD